MSTVILNPTDDAYVLQGMPSTNFGGEVRLLVGKDGVSGIAGGDIYSHFTYSIGRSFLRFNLLSIPINATIVNASLQLFIRFEAIDGGGYGTFDFQIRRLSETFEEMAIDWNSQPSDSTSAPLSYTINQDVSLGPTNLNLDMTADIVAKLASREINWSIHMYDESEALANGYDVVFGSKELGESVYWPTLTINYTTPPTGKRRSMTIVTQD